MAENKGKPRSISAKLIEAQQKLCETMEKLYKQEIELNAFRKSNNLLEEELVRSRSTIESLSKTNDRLEEELQAIKKSGFFARLFNRKKKQ